MAVTTISGPGAVDAAPALADNPLEVDDMTDRTCSVDGCARQPRARGWCGAHYERWRRYGDPCGAGVPSYPFPENLLRRLLFQPNGCVEFTGALERNGYARISIRGRNEMAHRASYELTRGPIPDGKQLDHLCRNRACVNPAHLEPVTLVENVMRGDGITATNARKTVCQNGHPFDEANTYLRPCGRRRCRTCLNEWQRNKNRRLKENA